MRKIIKLTESQYNRLMVRVLKEQKRFHNQDLVDAILDKINEFCVDSLSDEEKNILYNPDEKLQDDSNDNLDFDDIIMQNPIISELISAGFIDPQSIMILDDNSFQIGSVVDDEGNLFRYFEDGNKIKLITHIDGGELMVEADEDVNNESKMELMSYIKEMWQDVLGIPIFVDGIDY